MTTRPARQHAASALAVLLLALGIAAPAAGQGAVETEEDLDLRARIQLELSTFDREGADIGVAVRAGSVVLHGRVRLLEQSLRAEQAVWKTDGVTDVENELRVAPFAAAADDAIELRIRTIIEGGDRFLDNDLELDVVAGVVRLRGLFRDPSDVLALKHRIAAIPGVLDIEIDAVLVADRPAPHAPLPG